MLSMKIWASTKTQAHTLNLDKCPASNLKAVTQTQKVTTCCWWSGNDDDDDDDDADSDDGDDGDDTDGDANDDGDGDDTDGLYLARPGYQAAQVSLAPVSRKSAEHHDTTLHRSCRR